MRRLRAGLYNDGKFRVERSPSRKDWIVTVEVDDGQSDFIGRADTLDEARGFIRDAEQVLHTSAQKIGDQDKKA